MSVMHRSSLDSQNLGNDSFKLFRQLILDESGIYFSHDQKDSLVMSLTERLLKGSFSSFDEYYNFIVSHPRGRAELRLLLELITIGETEFFRTPAQLDVFSEFILPEIIRRKRNILNRVSANNFLGLDSAVIKIWSAGCSTGEEPYSLAIKILEIMPEADYHTVSILATDVNCERLSRAKLGLYKGRSLRNLGQAILDKYFIQRGDKYELSDEVKRLVRFTEHNLVKDAINIEYMKGVDVIFCRNVLIYFGLEATKRVIDKFHESLNDQGSLFIGPAESLWQISTKFKSVEFPHVFVYKKQLVDVPLYKTEKPFINIPELDLDSISTDEKEALISDIEEIAAQKEKFSLEAIKARYQEGIELFNRKEHGKALAVFNGVIDSDPNFLKAYFAKATILSNQGKYKEATAELKKIIKIDNLFIEAYYLMGVLSNKLEDFNRAIEEFKKVVYIDPEIVLAHFNQANIFYCQGKHAQAKREFRNTINILERKPKDEIITFSEGVTTEVLLAACKKNIETVRQK